METRQHILELITEHDRRLQVREKQAAQQGISVEPLILNEIDDIKSQMKALQVKYGEIVIMESTTMAFELLWLIQDLEKYSAAIAAKKKQITAAKKKVNLLMLRVTDKSDELEDAARELAESKQTCDDNLKKLREQREKVNQTKRDFIEYLNRTGEWMEAITPKH